MIGISLKTTQDRTELLAIIDPLLLGEFLDIEELKSYIDTTEFSHYELSQELLKNLSEAVSVNASEGNVDEIVLPIGHRPVSFKILLSDDEMTATLRIETPDSGHLPSVQDVIIQAKQLEITRGLSKKRIKTVLEQAHEANPGKRHEQIIAKGLPARRGKDSFVKPLVPNALERILSPTKLEGDKVDMRNLGDILCVDAKQAVAERKAPTLGRTGFTVTNKALIADTGDWKEIKLGENTILSDKDENLILAKVAGQPRFVEGKMSIDETFISKGVNVGTGNIKYHGAVIVNGDVTENMKISSDGDVTINGFVESAMIRSGGDIIITQGATGKMNEEDCQLIAKGSVFIEHGQGLDIIAGKDVKIGKQLAYSRVKCRGSVIVGKGDVPMGNLFASKIKCYSSVRAGTVGAVSGSQLHIDFSSGFKLFAGRLESLSELHKNLTSQNVDHEYKATLLSHKHIPDSLRDKVQKLTNEIEAERDLLKWLSSSLHEMKDRLEDYERNARVIANKELFPGVSVKMNKKIWESNKEYRRCRIILDGDNWKYDPIV